MTRDSSPVHVLAVAVALAVLAPAPALGASDAGKNAAPAAPLLASTADLLARTTLAAYVLTFPPSLLAHAAVPITPRISALAYAGYAWFPGGAGVAASGALKAVVLAPDAERWGLAAMAQWIGGAAVWLGEGAGGTVGAIEAVASSPVRRTRVHAALVLHTMPGSEFEEGWSEAKRYDIENPQIALSLAAGHAFGPRWSAGVEAIWGGIFADEGDDSVLGALATAGYARGRTTIAAGAGIVVSGFYASYSDIAPAPPLIRVSHTF